jgi:golgi-specific brefeldin A-resistance guanine nucleotide exchange factor 1
MFTDCMSSELPLSTLEALVDALLDEIPEDNGSGVVISVKPENPAPTSPNSAKTQAEPNYDPALVYILEYCTILALRDEGTVEVLGKRVIGALQTVLRDVTQHHWIVVGRATFYLFSLLRASYVRTSLTMYPSKRQLIA